MKIYSTTQEKAKEIACALIKQGASFECFSSSDDCVMFKFDDDSYYEWSKARPVINHYKLGGDQCRS